MLLTLLFYSLFSVINIRRTISISTKSDKKEGNWQQSETKQSMRKLVKNKWRRLGKERVAFGLDLFLEAILEESLFLAALFLVFFNSPFHIYSGHIMCQKKLQLKNVLGTI